MCLSVAGLLTKEILRRKSFLKETTALGSDPQNIFKERFSNNMSSKLRIFPPLLLQNSIAGDFLTRDILLNLLTQETHPLLLPASRISSSHLMAYNSFADFKSTRSLMRAMNSFSYSTAQEEQKNEEERKQKDQFLKLLAETRFAKTFYFNTDSDFLEIRDQPYFNDRTEMIAYAIEKRYLLLFHPRRSGKTTSLTTLRAFFEKKLNEAGEKDEDKHKQIETLFYGGDTSINGEQKKSFDPLKIANIEIRNRNSKEWYGKFPSLVFDFTQLKDAKTKEEAQKRLIEMISNKYEEHSYLLKNLDPSKQEKFNTYKNNNGSISIEQMILNLCDFLFKHHKEKVAVFIDELDYSFNHILGQEKPNYQLLVQISDVITSFLGCLSKQVEKKNVQYVIACGVYDNLLKGVSGANNFTTFNVNTTFLRGYYGLSQEEVENNVKRLLDPNQEKYEEKFNLLMKRIQYLYNGYYFEQQKSYNIWSVFNYLEMVSMGKEQNLDFWGQSISNTVIMRILRECKYPNLRNKLLRIGLGESQQLSYHSNVDLTLPIGNLSEDQLERYATSILLNGGYITRDIANPKNFVIPNEEIRVLFTTFIPAAVNQGEGEASLPQQLIDGISEVKGKKIKDVLEIICMNFVSCRHYQAPKDPENFSGLEISYVSLLTGLLLSSSDFEMKKEEEIGKGYADIILTPKNKNLLGNPHRKYTIIEVKALPSKKKRTEGNLENLAKEAIAQIKNQKYTSRAQINDIKDCLLIGIAFHKKDVAVELEIYTLPDKVDESVSETKTSS